MAQGTLLDAIMGNQDPTRDQLRRYWSESKDSGPVEPGNIDHVGRPVVALSEGGYGTVKSGSFQEEKDGLHILIPLIFEGKEHDWESAKQHYRETGEHLGKFKTHQQATAFSMATSQAIGDGMFAGPPRTR